MNKKYFMNEKDTNSKNENFLPLVSIGIPVYNGLTKNHKFSTDIRKALSSILSQTYQDFEIIIIDDEISKKSSEILKNISKISSKIRIIQNKKNLGAGSSRNEGIKNSKGDYIAFLDKGQILEYLPTEEFVKSENPDVSKFLTL